ncbi:putative 2-hydroxyacid dehydrogenase YoaD [Adhaeribacter aerolatus]|uniref:Putative 2-hydroxyacid dehydrogenase YoaD n=1 Tax=Adhaeribacter aerolatus TaxID=670289 RepID=A0A512AV21_9BACT|nr:2-hydroxyacid dehydrogenase [Adhaeribacter aerolatus]GEO03562.1 putative 2-hydroxyacid dehydrogenase YoaD [Adhaeribacter aerolatus]
MRILITAPYHEKAQAVLAQTFGEIIYRPWKPHGRAYNAEELISLLKETHADALITEHDNVTAEVIEIFPDLRFIGVCRGTPSNVAVEKATEYDIPVFHTPARNAQAVAEMFVANVITFLRNTIAGCEWLAGENWEAGAHTSYLQFKGNELAGRTIGMVGFGAIGQRIAEMVKNFPCPIQFYDPYVKQSDSVYKKTTLEDIFETSDIVSIHLPVTDQTKGMIDKTLISRMKKDAIFVNTARAVVVNREDLLDALENNQIRGAILDVFDHEPPDATDYRIIHRPNVLATPHIAGATFEVEDHHAFIMNDALKSWFTDHNRNIKQLANKEILTVKS